MMNSGSLYDLKSVLGHADIKTTERYANLSSSHLLGVKDIIQPNIGKKADVLSVDAFSRNQGATYPIQKSVRGQDDVSISVNGLHASDTLLFLALSVCTVNVCND